MNERAVNGDFHVIRMDGLFHVVFRPDADPEWFRIIGTFFTYERAYSYCDIERVSVWQDEKYGPESHTGEEEVASLRSPPVHLLPASAQEEPDGVRELVRNVYDADAHVPPHPVEDFSDHPTEDEPPKAYHDRVFAEAIAREADKPTCVDCGALRSPSSALRCRKCYQGDKPVDDSLTQNQLRVLGFLLANANRLRLVNATWKFIADGSGLLPSNVPPTVEAIERKGLLEIVERPPKPGRAAVFRLSEKAPEAIAQGIEAGTAETAKQGSVHESQVLEEDVPKAPNHPSQGGLHDR